MNAYPDNCELSLELQAEKHTVQDVRQAFEEFVRPLGLSDDDVDGLKVALSEAFSNAVCHGSPRGPLDRVWVRFQSTPEELVLEVTDEGRGFQPREIALPRSEEWKPSGRGLFLMQALADGVEFEPTETGTRVRLIKRLQPNRNLPAHEAEPARARPESAERHRLAPAAAPALG